MTTVAIIGTGPLGRWLALDTAGVAFRVLLEDTGCPSFCAAPATSDETVARRADFWR